MKFRRQVKNHSNNGNANYPTTVKVDTVKTTVLRTSNGRAVAKGDYLLMRYQGNLVNKDGSIGAEFDANFNFNTLTEVTGKTLFSFELGANPNQVIQGWEQGLLGRKTGEVLELTIPPSLGYGSAGTTGIPKDSTLRFRVEILGAYTPNPDLFAPESTPGYSFATLQDLGIKPAEIGLTINDLLNVSASRLGLDGADALVGKDLAASSTLPATKAKRDLILGLAGDDIITGGQAGDFLIGGPGKNTYVYKSISDSTPIDSKTGSDAGRDKIFGFTSLDKIDLSAIDANPKVTGDQAFKYLGSSAFTGTASEVRFVGSTATTPGILQINILNATGDKTADMEIALIKTTTFNAANVVL